MFPRDTIVASVALVAILTGCALAPRYPVPKESVNSAQVAGFPQIRIMLDADSTNLLGTLGAVMPSGTSNRAALKILSLSGGGENGAFGAGLLCGWTESGTRPQFDVVTGISTGSLIAPLAFLGPQFDPQLRHGYTEIKPNEVFLMRNIFGILKHRDAVADSQPLQKLIADLIGEKELVAIAREHRKGRRLLVMTTNLDAQKPVIWDIGAIAASGRPDSLKLIGKILLASSSIPVAFPPVLFDVQVNGCRFDELHVDGGVLAQAFGGGLLLADPSRPVSDLYLIRNGRLGPEYGVTQRKIAAIAGRSIGTMMRMQAESDVLRLWTFAHLSGSHFYYVSIPDEFTMELKEPFEPKYMKALFEVGYQQALHGIPWQQTPAGLRPLQPIPGAQTASKPD